VELFLTTSLQGMRDKFAHTESCLGETKPETQLLLFFSLEEEKTTEFIEMKPKQGLCERVKLELKP
jgi:hypothetical protein